MLYSSFTNRTAALAQPWLLLAALVAEALLLTCPYGGAKYGSAYLVQQTFVQYSIAYLPYLVAIYWLARAAPSGRSLNFLLLAALVLRLLAWPLPPLLSDDLERYRWEAETWARGANPYLTTPRETIPHPDRIPGPDARAVYGPWLQAAHWLAWRAGALKASGALAEGILMLLVWYWTRITHLPPWRFAVYSLCPLPIIEYWRQGHNDAWLVLFLFASLVVLRSGKAFPAWALLTLAILTKWWPALLLPWYAYRAFSPAGAALLLGTGLALVFGPGWPFWQERIRFTTGFLGGWSNNAFLANFLSSKWQAVAIYVAGAASLPWWRTTPMRMALYASTGVLVWAANIHPWYLLWTLPFAAVAAPAVSPWLLACSLSPLFYEPVVAWNLLGIWREDGVLRASIWSAVTLFALFRVWSARSR
ncbi:MAG: hypothetical protein NW208_14090 [Bryobacter sp.]|nr:hypothetical protein [Bryobacter sp.]